MGEKRQRDMTPQDHLEVLYNALTTWMESKGWSATYGTIRIESVGEDWGKAATGVTLVDRVTNPHHAYRLVIPFNGHIQVQANKETPNGETV